MFNSDNDAKWCDLLTYTQTHGHSLLKLRIYQFFNHHTELMKILNMVWDSAGQLSQALYDLMSHVQWPGKKREQFSVEDRSSER